MQDGVNAEKYLDEGLHAVETLNKAAEIARNPCKVARLMKDIGRDGQVDSEEFRPVFEELRQIVAKAFV